MKTFFFNVLFSLFLFSCSKNNINNSNCNFLLNIGVNLNVNMSLPQFSQLQFVSNSVYVPNAGNGGIIVTNSGTGFLAWDASDPNHTPSSCSVLTITGLEGNCGCSEANIYSLITGQPLNNSSLRCGLKSYRVEVSGNNLFITN